MFQGAPNGFVGRVTSDDIIVDLVPYLLWQSHESLSKSHALVFSYCSPDTGDSFGEARNMLATLEQIVDKLGVD